MPGITQFQPLEWTIRVDYCDIPTDGAIEQLKRFTPLLMTLGRPPTADYFELEQQIGAIVTRLKSQSRRVTQEAVAREIPMSPRQFKRKLKKYPDLKARLRT
jgi:hypothetical protein